MAKGFPKKNVLTDSELGIVEKNGEKLFIKKIGFSKEVYGDIAVFHKFLTDYISQFKKAGIPLPKIEESYVENGRVVFVSRYCGENILEKLGKEKPENLIKLHKDEILKMLDIIRLSQKNGLYLDPHVKNFIFDKEGIHYTDFAPPYTQEYFRFKIKFVKDKDRKFMGKIFNIFSPSEVGYHFMADLIKMDEGYIKIMKELHALMKEKGIIDMDYDDSLKRAISIKELEEEKRRRNLFTSPL